ncbi:CBS domain-containing protein, partial [Marinicauda pacifica]
DPAPVTESALLANAQAFDRLRVSDVMVPRADITAVDVETPLHELAVIFSNAAHSRLPIYRDTLDAPIGVAHIKDVITHLTGDEHGNRSTNWAELQLLPQIRRPL